MKSLKLHLILLAGLFIFTSCGKEDLSSKDKDMLEIKALDPGDVDGTRSAVEREEDEKKKDREEWKACFEIIYPLTYTMPDGTTVSGNNEGEIGAAIKAWYEANPDTKDKYTLVYPILILWDGETISVDNGEKIRGLVARCKEGKDKDKGEWKSCFDLVYPVSYTMPDGSTITGNEEKELYTALKAWYEVNPDIKEEATLIYPVDIVFEDGSTATIDNEIEMKRVKEDCD